MAMRSVNKTKFHHKLGRNLSQQLMLMKPKCVSYQKLYLNILCTFVYMNYKCQLTLLEPHLFESVIDN